MIKTECTYCGAKFEADMEARDRRIADLEAKYESSKRAYGDLLNLSAGQDRRIAELEAGLRRIASLEGVTEWALPGRAQAASIARDLLAGRAAGGEG